MTVAMVNNKIETTDFDLLPSLTSDIKKVIQS